MAALPLEPDNDPLDPQRILSELPAREHGIFLAAYRRAVDGARDPAGWKDLRRLLRLWSLRAVAVSQPGFYEGRDAARAGARSGMHLDDAVRQLREAR